MSAVIKRASAVALALITALAPVVPTANANTFCGTATVKTLYAGQWIDTGTVTVANDAAKISVTITTRNGWYFTQTHLAIATSLAAIPQTTTKNPKVGQFPYGSTHDPAVQTYTYEIPKDTLATDLGLESVTDNTTLYIAVHAEVELHDSNGAVIQKEGGWAEGYQFNPELRPSRSWAMYFIYDWQPCNQPVEGFRTQTQGGWGAVCKGQNPGCYRDAHFEDVFLSPSGLVIGGGHTITLTDAEAVENFLPQGGTPAALTKNHVDPTSTEAGVLAGQLVAATLNVYFDLEYGDFGASQSHLADLRVVDGTSACYLWTVQQVLDEGNQVLGGGGTLTPSRVNDCLTGINEAFVDGNTVSGFLGW